MPPKRKTKRPKAVVEAEVKAALARAKQKKSSPGRDPKESFYAAIAKIRDAYGENVIRTGDTFPTLERVPCGIFGLDLALGVAENGIGFPRGRINLIVGPESCCKTLICLWLIREFLALGEPVVYVNTENPWDKAWVKANGIDPAAVFVEPSENAERTLDILAELVRAMPDGLVVVDSFASLTPTAEIECSFGEWQQGLMARLSSKAYRSIQSGQNSASTEFLTRGVTVVAVQQYRSNIQTGGKVIPGGSAQLFAASTITALRGGPWIWHAPGKGISESDMTPKDSPDALCVGRTFKYDVSKNKTSAPHRTGEFRFYTTRIEDPSTEADIHPATTDSAEQMLRAAVIFGIVERAGSWYSFNGENLGQGAATAATVIDNNDVLFNTIREAIFEKVSPGWNK